MSTITLSIDNLHTAAAWIEHDVLDNCWPKGKTLEEAAAECESNAKSDGIVIDGDMEDAILEKAEDEGIAALAELGRLDIVRTLAETRSTDKWDDADHQALAKAVNADLSWLPNGTVMELIDILID